MHIFLITLCCFFFFFFFQFSVLSNSKSDFIILNQSITDGETLVSSGRRSELGFFAPGNSQNRYLGIWQKVTPETVIWVANYNNPITDYSGVLTVTKTEGFVILNQTGSNTIIWSSNSSTVAEKGLVLQLLDSGNLVLVESSSGSYLWQSFNYPSNTVLPGMKLGWNSETGQEQYLTSWKSASDPSPGEFTYKLHSNGLPQLVVGMGDTKIFRSGPWNGLRFNGFPAVINSVFEPILVLNKDNNMYTMYETYNDSIVTRNTLNESGLLNRYVAKQSSTEWALLFTRPYDLCDEYGKCGPNGVCKIYQSTICECLKGFIPNSKPEWDVLDWSHGCRRRTPLNCQSGEGFVKVVNVKLPDLLKFWLNKSMSLEECKGECLKNCSCVAYTISNITAKGSGCLMWFGDLIDIVQFIEEYTGQDIYLRLASSELESMRNSKKKKRLEIIVVVVSTISALLTLGLICWWIIWKKRTMTMGRGEDWELPLFDLATIVTATNNFSQTNMIGGGGFGSVYKGYLPTGQEIAVKRLSKSSQQGLEEFKNEVVSIAKLQHRNLVKLLGCCVQGEERILIYEFMPNKSLDYFIFDKSDSTRLSWQQRYDIALGIARGLLYLHQDSRLKIIHRDLKTSNILLDCNMNPKISDFGLARIFGGDEIYAKTKRIVGTYGYMSPEYAIDGKFSVQSDVFSFGVLMLEIVSGKKNRGFSHPDHHHTLLGHAWLLWNEDKGLEVMDPCLMDSFVETQVLRCVQVALLCVQKHPADRPTMSSVVFMLGSEGATLSKPKQPGFFIERSSTDTTESNEECYTKNSLTITMLEAR